MQELKTFQQQIIDNIQFSGINTYVNTTAQQSITICQNYIKEVQAGAQKTLKDYLGIIDEDILLKPEYQPIIERILQIVLAIRLITQNAQITTGEYIYDNYDNN